MDHLFWLAILPSIVLAHRVLSYDKIEKEPFSLLAKLFVLGMVSCLPAGIIESVGDIVVEAVAPTKFFYSLLTYMVLVPMAEELSKYVMLRTSRKHPAFNYTFDGIVYGVMVGLGFATLENVLYVSGIGTLSVAIMRGLFAVPMHCVCGVFMGYYYGVAKGLEVQGMHDRASEARLLSIAVPWVIHGLYDFALDTDSLLVLIAGLVLTLVVFVIAYRQVRFASAHDTPIMVGIRQPDASTIPHRRDWNSKETR